MANWQEAKESKIAEIVTDAYVVCFLLILVPLMQYFNLRSNDSIEMLFVFGVSFCAILVLAIMCIRSITKRNYTVSYKILDILLIILFLGIIGFIVHKTSFLYLEILYVIPVIITSISFPRKPGAIITGGIILNVIVGNCFLANETYTKITMMDLVVGGTILLVGWLLGELMAIERASRRRLPGTVEAGQSEEDIPSSVDSVRYRAKNIGSDKVELYPGTLSCEVTVATHDLLPHARVIISIIDFKDHYTAGHSERILECAGKMANYLKLPEREKETLLYAAYLHDIGKIYINSELLNRPGPLTAEEWSIFRSHPAWGRNIILPLVSDVTVALVILHHHENYDGTGYPHGISGTEIPLPARVLRVIDSYDAMTTDRPYRKAKTVQVALDEILACRGSIYDPQIAEKFASMMQAQGDAGRQPTDRLGGG